MTGPGSPENPSGAGGRDRRWPSRDQIERDIREERDDTREWLDDNPDLAERQRELGRLADELNQQLENADPNADDLPFLRRQAARLVGLMIDRGVGNIDRATQAAVSALLHYRFHVNPRYSMAAGEIAGRLAQRMLEDPTRNALEALRDAIQNPSDPAAVAEIVEEMERHYAAEVEREQERNNDGGALPDPPSWLPDDWFIERSRRRDQGGREYEYDVREPNPMYGYSSSIVENAARNRVPLTLDQQALLRSLDKDRFSTYFESYMRELARRAGYDTSEEMSLAELRTQFGARAYQDYRNNLLSLTQGLLSSITSKEGEDLNSRAEVQVLAQVQKSLGEVSSDLIGDIEGIGDIKVTYRVDTMQPDAEQAMRRDETGNFVGGMMEYVHIQHVEVDLFAALQKDIAKSIKKTQNVMVGSNNARREAHSDSDIDAMAKAAQAMDVEDIVWMFNEDRYLNLAMNFYLAAVERQVAITGRTFTERYGLISEASGLEEPEEMALADLKAYIYGYMGGREGANRAGDPSHERILDKAFSQQLKRTVRMASGLAKSYSGEYWGHLSEGMNFYITSWNVDAEGHYERKEHYGSPQSEGLEKKVAQITPWFNDERFGRDKFPAIWHIIQPRDLDSVGSLWSRDPSMQPSPELFERVREEDMQARFEGPSDWMANVDDDYVMWKEFAWKASFDLTAMGSWRTAQYKRYAQEYGRMADRADITGMDRHEFVMNRLFAKGGPRLVYLYIDENLETLMKAEGRYDEFYAQWERVKGELTRKRYFGLLEFGKQFRAERDRLKANQGDAVLKKLKEEAYRRYMSKYVFSELQKRFASRFIGLENRRHTPRGERLIQDQLIDFLSRDTQGVALPPQILAKLRRHDSGFIQRYILPMYLQGVHVIERARWDEYSRNPDSQPIATGADTGPQLTAGDFSSRQAEDAIEQIYKQYKEMIGVITQTDSIDEAREQQRQEDEMHALNPDDPRYQVRHSVRELSDDVLSFEEFKATLPLFYQRLGIEIARPRYSRQEQNARTRETLPDRFARMTQLNQGNIRQSLSGALFDFRLELNKAGTAMMSRFWGGPTAIKDMSAAFANLGSEDGELMKFLDMGEDKTYDSKKDLRGAVAGIGEKLKELIKPAYSVPPTYREYAARNMIFAGLSFIRPLEFRNPVTGGLLGGAHRDAFRSGLNMFEQFYGSVQGRNIYSGDTDDMLVIMRQWATQLKIPFSRFTEKRKERLDEMAGYRRAAIALVDGARRVPVIGPVLAANLSNLTAYLTRPRATEFIKHDHHLGTVLKTLGLRYRDIATEAGSLLAAILVLSGAGAVGMAGYQAGKKLQTS